MNHTEPKPQRRDIVVIGASAGGVEALLQLAAGLPSNLPAAVFITLHMSPSSRSLLPELLTKRGRLPATSAIHGEPIVPGRIYVAPPDNHLIVRPGHVNVVRGPRENGHRPSVDVLFRSAAAAYGPRTIGVVLTGYLDCGTAGMLSIKARGGVAVVQDPDEARAADMPRSVMKHVEIDHVAPLREMGRLLVRLTSEPASDWPAQLATGLMEIEGDNPGVLSGEVVCPSCQGVLREATLNGFRMFRCHVGHAFTFKSLVAEQAQGVERALWCAARALEESAALARRLAACSTGDARRRFEERARDQTEQAKVINEILSRWGVLSADDAPLVDSPSSKPGGGEGS